MCCKRILMSFPVRAHAQVAGSIPSEVCARGSKSMILIVGVSISPFSFPLRNQSKNMYFLPKPVWLSGRASVCGLKGPGFDSGQGHVHWLRAHPRWGVCKRQLVDVSLSLMFLALCLSLPLCKKSIKYRIYIIYIFFILFYFILFYFLKCGPSWFGSVYRASRAHARVVGSVPNVRCAGGSRSMVFSHY
uniref:Uncharacterized protein n=1 Tax=Pipistrellus kuhlii TaxID=59472 RepID=A0A7J7R9V9_PIPKU|nr:hypothetical protein mPipKuh1_010715 [Pipistrellus kuhlii]